MLRRSLPAILLELISDGIQVFALVLRIFLLALEFAHSLEHALFLHLKCDIFPDKLVQIVLESGCDPRATPAAQDFVGFETLNLSSQLGFNALHAVL